MIDRIDHVAIAVRNLESSLRFWAEALGLELERLETVEQEGVKTAMIPVGDVRIELLEPIGTRTPVGRFLDKRGEGMHHITFGVRDLDAALEKLGSAGISAVGEAPRTGAGGRRVAFLNPRECGGVLIELVEGPAPAPRSETIEPGESVLLYLREPQEKLWGVLRRLDGAGVVLEGIDLASFDDWVAQIERDEPSVVGPSVLFVPTGRLEKILLDRSSGHLPSLAERFERRTGRSVREVLG